MDQSNSIKFSVRNEINYARTFEMLAVSFGESTISRTKVQLWYNRFKEGREDLNDNAYSGRSNTSTTDENIEAGQKMILDNRQITIREVTDNVDISFGLCQVIFTHVLDIKREAAKIIPKLINFDNIAWTSLRRC